MVKKTTGKNTGYSDMSKLVTDYAHQQGKLRTIHKENFPESGLVSVKDEVFLLSMEL